MALSGGLAGDEGRLLQGRFHGSSSYASTFQVFDGRPGISTPNCFAYSAFNRCQPPNFMSVGADHASDRLAREEPIQDVEADVPARGAPGDEAAIDVVPEREARAAAAAARAPSGGRRRPSCTRAASAPRPASRWSRRPAASASRPSRASPAPRRPGSDRRRTAPIRTAAQDRSAPARPSPADGGALGRG